MRARIFRPSRNAMTSGRARTKRWMLEYFPSEPRRIDPLMGWTSLKDTQPQVRLSFDTREEAVEYAEENGIDAVVIEPTPPRPNIRPGGYGENFATSRRGTWSH